MNAIEFLLKEHAKVRKMFAEINEGSHRDETKKNMFDELCQELLRHEDMEQSVWYPNLKDNEKLNAIIKHLMEEEKDAEESIKDFDEDEEMEEWEEKFSQLKEDVEHHASEEESKLFPKVEKALTSAELDALGKKMREFKATSNESDKENSRKEIGSTSVL